MSLPIQRVIRLALETFSQTPPSLSNNTNNNCGSSSTVLVNGTSGDHSNTDKSATDRGPMESSLSRLAEQVGRLTASDVAFDQTLVRDTRHVSQRQAAPPMTYVELLECETVSVGIFVLYNGFRMPIHDHPHMYGVLKVLYGNVRIQSYSAVLDESGEWQSRSDAATGSQLWRTRLEPPKRLGPSDGVALLTPNCDNIHQVSAEGGPAAFLDILAPPYDDHQRIYHTYEEHRRKSDGEVAECWLKTGDSTPFKSGMAQYRGPPLDGVLAEFRAQHV